MPQDSVNPAFWAGRRVFVTGHTGFMGGWLCTWLSRLGAEVHGYALAAPSEPSFYETTGLSRDLSSTIADVRDRDALAAAMRRARPEIVLHLAAQPLVRAAAADPVGTYATNVMGTVHLLDAMRACPTVTAAVVVTTDKVYENKEWEWGYRETDALGGREPYGNSKACSELVVEAFRQSYFSGAAAPGIATVRAGNIIGGGDWAADRLVPDAMRAFADGRALEIRHPEAVRPWQHVLEPVRGFLMLAERLTGQPADFSSGWNFGPAEADSQPVGWMADRLVSAWGDAAEWRSVAAAGPHEATLLTLSSVRAKRAFGWETKWTAETAIRRTVEWYRAFYANEDVRKTTERQIADFEKETYHGSEPKEAASRDRDAARTVARPRIVQV
ncbi:MAG TPA: CDP-glucose 4,6-dehydratase [Alphaproteobacteria bacterium]|jgi:CDP-glucose 4,6-dehydratase